MNALANISIQYNLETKYMKTKQKSKKILSARSTIYGAVSAIFSGPESDKFSMLMSHDLRKCVSEACFELENQKNEKHTISLLKSFRKLINKLDSLGLEKIKDISIDIFGHIPSKQIAPYALEHLKNSDVFFRTQKLADLNGFYKALGMEVESIERADHISTQTEFLSFLLLKEILAHQNHLGNEKEICKKAIVDFQKDHFLNWVEIFSENLVNYVDEQFYPLAGKFLGEFIRKEKSNLHLVNETQCI